MLSVIPPNIPPEIALEVSLSKTPARVLSGFPTQISSHILAGIAQALSVRISLTRKTSWWISPEISG